MSVNNMKKITIKSTVVTIALAFLLAAFAPVSTVFADSLSDRHLSPPLLLFLPVCKTPTPIRSPGFLSRV